MPAMNLADNANPAWAEQFGITTRNGYAFPMDSAAQLSMDPGFQASQPGSVSQGYTEMNSLGMTAEGIPNIGLTYHRSADERLQSWQSNIEDAFVNAPDNAAVATDQLGRLFGAATYGARRLTSDTLNGVIGLPRILTSDSMVPGLINGFAHPIDSTYRIAQAVNGMALQDKLMTVAEIGLTGVRGIESLAGKLPGAGKYLGGTLSYGAGRGVVLTATDGIAYGFAGEGVATIRSGPLGYQAGSAGGVKFGPLDATNSGTGSVAATLSRVEDRFAGASREVGFIVDSQTGDILAVRRAGLGNGTQISLDANIDFPLMKGNVFTHNHPLGGNLSPGDVSTAIGSGTMEFRAVTPTRTTSIMFNNAPDGLIGEPGAAVVFMNGEKSAIASSYRASLADGSLMPPTDLATKNVWMSDYFMQQLSARNPWIQYTVTPR